MPAHEHFLELGTLAAVGQISDKEDRELREHWAECIECRDAYAEYSMILSRDLPNLNPTRHRLRNQFIHPSASVDIRDRFLARARQQGAEFSREVEAEHLKQRVTPSMFRPTRVASAAAILILLVGEISVSVRSRTAIANQAQQISRLTASNAKLTNELSHVKDLELQNRQAPPSDSLHKTPELDTLREQSASLMRQLQDSKQHMRTLENLLAALQRQNVTLANSHQQDQTLIGDLQKQLSREKDAANSTVASLIESQEKIKSLDIAVKEAGERIVMERQLSSVSSDVRQLMGARNLHIIDVHDINAAGKTDKSFGRVFYAENQSLIFYAFDLPASKSAKYTFQAWGQAEANERSLHSIGTFSVDNHEQRRWVLKVSDPSLLKGIDSVFVTAETHGDGTLPKGKRVLYAYLAGHANHP